MYETLKNISLVVTISHLVIALFFMFRYKYSKKVTLLIGFFGGSSIIITNALLIFLLNTMEYINVMWLSLLIPTFILLLLISSDKGFKFIFTYFFIFTIVFWIIQVTGLLDNSLKGNGWILFFSRFFILPIGEYIIYRYVKKPYAFLLKNLKFGWEMLSLLTILYYFILIISSSYPTLIYNRPDDYLIYSLILLFMPLMYWVVFLLLNKQIQIHKTNEINNLLKHQQEQLELQLDNQNEIRKINHNLKAYINTLSILINNQEYDKAKVEIEKITKLYNYTDNLCPNNYINVILTNYRKKFVKHNILFKADAFKCPPELNNITELILILSSAFDNAYECLLKLKSNSKKVSIKIKRNGSYLLIRISNTCDKSLIIEEGTIPETTKLDKGHGIGLHTIIETANNLGGDAVCYAKDGEFTLDIVVKI